MELRSHLAAEDSQEDYVAVQVAWLGRGRAGLFPCPQAPSPVPGSILDDFSADHSFPFSYISVLVTKLTLNSNWSPNSTDNSHLSSPRMNPTFNFGVPNPPQTGFDSLSLLPTFLSLPRHRDTIYSPHSPRDPENHLPASAMVHLAVIVASSISDDSDPRGHCGEC